MKKIFISMAVVMTLLFSCLPVHAAGTAQINVPIEHKIEGIQTDEVFNFTIEKTNEAPLPENTTLQIKGDGKTYINITYDAAGKYTYIVKEIEGGTKTIKYDDTEYKLVVTVTEIDGKLTPTVTLDDGENTKPDKLSFKDYSQATASIIPSVRKTIKDNKDYKDTFRFEITDENGYKDITSVKGEGVAKFKEIKFEKPGTYLYKIRELKDKTSKWNYDETVHSLKVTVTEKDNKLTAVSDQSTFEFTNSPKLIRKVERLAKIVTGGGTTKTGDTAKYLGTITLLAAAALGIMFIVGSRRKK